MTMPNVDSFKHPPVEVPEERFNEMDDYPDDEPTDYAYAELDRLDRASEGERERALYRDTGPQAWDDNGWSDLERD